VPICTFFSHLKNDAFLTIFFCNPLSISNNLFSGTFPDVFDSWKGLTFFSVSDNTLSGTLPQSIGLFCSGLTNVFVFSNLFTGSLPSTFGNLTNLEHFYGGGNAFSGSIPSSFSAMTRLRHFWFPKNQLTGSLDPLLGMTSLDYLNLSGNLFRGVSLPDSIGNLRALTSLFLAECNFVGTIPESIGALELASLVNLDENQFSGQLPNSIGNWSNIERFVARVSCCFVRAELVGWVWKHPLTESFLTVSRFFQDNNLEGTIPESIAQWSRLRFLYLSVSSCAGAALLLNTFLFLISRPRSSSKNNNLTGPIPDLSGFTNLLRARFENNTGLTGSLEGVCSNAVNLVELVVDCDDDVECSCCIECG